jgi:ornithine cyclodeaminase/alanine dehydrogenase-like protein (mu-crystallin family)
VNAAGSNFPDRRELASSVIARAGLIVVDSKEQARHEAGDLLIPIEEGVVGWEDVRELGTVLREGRTDDWGDGITIFKSLGIAIEDVAVARHVYDEAIRLGIGETTTFGELNG